MYFNMFIMEMLAIITDCQTVIVSYCCAEGGISSPVSVPYIQNDVDQPYKFTFHGKIYNTGAISSVTSDKDNISVTMSEDKQQAEVGSSRV